MLQVLLVIHIIISVALVGVILVQKSDGGGLGIGGPGNVMSARGSANLLTRATSILAVAFIVLSLALAIVSGNRDSGSSVMEQVQTEAPKPDTPKIPDNQ